MLGSSGVDSFLGRFKSNTAPYYREFEPEADLLPYVACTWIRIVRHPTNAALTPIIPDGCADIMVYDDHPPRVAGPDATTRWSSLADGLVITGIRLRPGAAGAVLGCPANLIANREIPLSDIAGKASILHHSLLAASDLDARLFVLSDWVRRAFAQAGMQDRLVISACRRLISDPHAEIDSVAREVDWTPRMIHRRFVAACGYGPKHFQQIMRVQKAIRAMHSTPRTSFAEIAARAGYADQAHMSRDFRSITGFTPATHRETMNPAFGAWIDSE